MAEDVELLEQFVDGLRGTIDAVVLLGMGGSSLAPEVLRRSFGVETFHVLDSTHPQAIRDLEARIDVRAHALPLVFEVRLDARDALANRLLLGAAPGRCVFRRGHRSRLVARAARARARVRRDLSR